MTKATRVLSLQELIDQEDPLAGMTKGDAIKYATKMGASDSLRGLSQMGSSLFGFDGATEELKRSDQKLQRILDHEEWGGAAMGAFLTSAIIADPIGYIPIIGWGKKAKTVKDLAKYGAMAGGTHAGMSYVSEDQPGLLGEKQSRLENIVLGTGFGSTLGIIGGKGANVIATKLGKEKPFPTKVIETPKDDVIADDFVGPLNIDQRNRKDIHDRIKYQESEDFIGPRKILSDEEKLQQSMMEEFGSKTKLSAGLQKFYEDKVGRRARDFVFNNWGSTLSGTAGGVIGYNAFDDPDATYKEKFGAAFVGMALGFGGAKGLGRIKFQDEAVSDHLSRLLVDDYGLNPEYIKLRGDIAVNKNAIGQEFFEITNEIATKLNKEERSFLYGFMTGDLASISKGATLSAKARKTVTKYANEMVDLGLLNKKVFKANEEIYLKRTYTKHLNKKTVGRGEVKTVRKKSFMADELKGRGIQETNVSQQKWEDVYKVENKTLDPKARWKIIEGNEGGSGKLTIRRDFTKAERVEMGEIEDAAYALAETGRLMAHDISMAKFFRELSTDPKFSKSAKEWKEIGEPQNWVKVSSSKIYKTNQKAFGELAGRYVPKEIMQDLQRTVTIEPDNVMLQEIATKLDGAMRVWKKSKTAWNPAVHMNNVMSNMILLDFADAPHTSLPRALKELRNKDGDLYKTASKYGVFDVDIVSRELREMGGEIEKNLLKFTDGKNPTESLNYADGMYKGAVKKGWANTVGKMEDVYQVEDQVFRMAVFMDRLSKGKGIREAAMDSKRWFIDYDINAPAINLAKKTVTPFISYTYRVVPLLAETVTMKPWKVAKWAAFGYAMNYIGNQAIGSEESERASMRDSQSNKLWGVPFMPPTMMKLPFKSETNESQYLDVTRWVPGGDVFESKEIGRGLPGVPAAIQPGGLYVDLAKILLAQQDPFTGKDIEGYGEDENTKAIFKAIIKSFTPNNPLVPSSYSQDKIIQALRKKGYFGLEDESIGDSPYSAPPSVIEALTSAIGIKLRPQDTDRNLSLRAIEYNKLLESMKQTLKKAGRDLSYGRISEEEYDEIRTRQEEKIIEAANEYQAMYERVLDAERREEEERLKKVTGGLIEGEGEVPYAKEKPEERINPFTGEPYTALYYNGGAVRKQYNDGGSEGKKVLEIPFMDVNDQTAYDPNNRYTYTQEQMPRGVRNYNYMNLAIGAVDEGVFKGYDNVARYSGVIGTDSRGTGSPTGQNEAYPIFKDKHTGLRAGIHNLLKKYDGQSMEEMFSKYSATDRDTYAQSIESLTGLNKHDKLNLRENPQLAVEVIRGIIKLENGLTKRNNTLQHLPSDEEILKAYQDSKVKREDSRYSKKAWEKSKEKIAQGVINKILKIK